MPVVNPPVTPAPQQASPFEFIVQAFGWMAQNWLILGAIALVAVVIYILYRMFMKQKEEEDIFLRDYKRTKDMCKLQANRKRIRPSPVPIYIFGVFIFLGISMLLVGVFINSGDFIMWAFGVFGAGIFVSALFHWGGFFVKRDRIYLTSGKNSRWLGNYGGECVTGSFKNFLLVRGLGPAKKQFVVRTNIDKNLEVELTDKEGKKTEVQKITLPEEPVIEGEDSILVKGIGLQQFKYFLYPVLVDEKGTPISMKFVATSTEKEIALVDTLYDQTSDFARIMREQVNINPSVRYIQKTKGESSQTE
jgi:hypothetical protein